MIFTVSALSLWAAEVAACTEDVLEIFMNASKSGKSYLDPALSVLTLSPQWSPLA